MKQLIENQMKEFREKFLSENNAGKICWSVLGMRTELVIDWHKQSLKQFIDELIASEQEYVDIINKNDNGTKFEEGYRDAKENSISHLKKLKEELN